MIETLRHVVHVAQSAIRERSKGKMRSPKWHEVEKHFLAKNKSCAACGNLLTLQVHHVEPFNLHPDLELDETNLIALCMGDFECHLRIGHGGSFDFYNPNVRKDASDFLSRPDWRQELTEKAKALRISLVRSGEGLPIG